MRNKRIYFLFSYLMFLSGCLVGEFESVSSSSTVEAPPCDVIGGTCTQTATADKVAQERVPFEFSFVSAVAGPTYYISNAPSWIQLDKVASKIYGTPSAPGTYSDIKISVYDGTLTEEIGPFAIVVDGDPLAQYAWHLHNTGQKTFSSKGGKSGQDIDLSGALALGYTGLGVSIAVSDEGAEIAHEDLTDNLLAGVSKNYLIAFPWIGDPTPSDPTFFHGTAVTGLIAAVGWNNLGSRGVAPNAQFASFNFLESDGSVAKYIDQASGAFDIFNYSYGLPNCSIWQTDPTYEEHLKSQVATERGGLGPLYVKAAGNDYVGDLSGCYMISPDLAYYAGNANFEGDGNLPYIITVGAVNASGKMSSYSTPGSNLWVSAPGGEFGTTSPAMITTDLSSCTDGLSTTADGYNNFDKGLLDLNIDCNYTSVMNGTSSATPTTSGVIALILEANPLLGWRDVKHILAMTADKIDTSVSQRSHPLGAPVPSGYVYQRGWVTNAAGNSFNNHYGFGRINAQKAVEMAETYLTLLPDFIETTSPHDGEWYYDSNAINLTIPDNRSSGRTHDINVKHNLVIEAVQIRLNVTHNFVQDLAIELTSPSGTNSILINMNSLIMDADFTDAVFSSNAFYGESSRGNWRLKVIDGYSGTNGVWNDWQIRVFGHVDPNPTDIIAPAPVTGLIVDADPNASLTATPEATWTASVATDVMRYEFSIGTAAGSTDVADWQSIGTALEAQETSDLTLVDGDTYYMNVRVVDTSENLSTVESVSWVADVP